MEGMVNGMVEFDFIINDFFLLFVSCFSFVVYVGGVLWRLVFNTDSNGKEQCSILFQI